MIRPSRPLWTSTTNCPSGFFPAQVLMDKAQVQFLVGDWAGAEGAYRRCLEAAGRGGDPDMAARIKAGLGNVLIFKGYSDEAFGMLVEAMEHYRAAGNPAQLAPVMNSLGMAYKWQGRLDKAEESFRSYLDLSERTGDSGGRASANGNLGILCAMRGDFQGALERFGVLERAAAELGDKSRMALAAGNIGLCFIALDRAGEAVGKIELKLELSRQIGDQLGICQALGSLGDASEKLGRYPEALEHYATALKQARAMESQVNVCLALEKMANISRLMGDARTALDLYLRALDLAGRIGKKMAFPDLWFWVGEARLDLGMPAEAEECFRKSLAFAGEIKYPFQVPSALLGLARASLGRKSFDQALDLCRQAAESARDLGLEEDVFRSRLWELRVRAARGEGIAPGLEEMLAAEAEPRRRAELELELWRATKDGARRAAALELYEKLYRERPRASYLEAIRELGGEKG